MQDNLRVVGVVWRREAISSSAGATTAMTARLHDGMYVGMVGWMDGGFAVRNDWRFWIECCSCLLATASPKFNFHPLTVQTVSSQATFDRSRAGG